MKYKRKKGKIENKIIIKRTIIISAIVSFIISTIVFLIVGKITNAVVTFVILIGISIAYAYMKIKLKEYHRVKKMEDVFPDFLQLISSNLRAGITTDSAMLLAARKEFAPLDEEIIRLGKELMTGRRIEEALLSLSERINSRKIKKTLNLIVSGIKSGGNIAILLEETASNSREKEFVEKRAASNVLMYVIFVFAAITIGAPALFGLSTVLVEILGGFLSEIPEIEVTANVPFTLSKITISPVFITYFSSIFLIAIGILGALVLGIITKGEEKEGLKYILPIIATNQAVFFAIKIVLGKYFVKFFTI